MNRKWQEEEKKRMSVKDVSTIGSMHAWYRGWFTGRKKIKACRKMYNHICLSPDESDDGVFYICFPFLSSLLKQCEELGLVGWESLGCFDLGISAEDIFE